MSGRDNCYYGANFLMKKMASTASVGALAKALSSLFAAVILVLVLVSSSANGGSVNDCHGVRYAYRERGLDLKDVPRQPRQGKIFSSGLVDNILVIMVAFIGDRLGGLG